VFVWIVRHGGSQRFFAKTHYGPRV
jgi:hypothetical protein